MTSKKTYDRIKSVNMETDFKKGIYKHFKGNYYTLLYVAFDSETLQKKVVYRAEYGDKQIWVRPAEMWDEEIILPNGDKVKRFTYVGKRFPTK